MVLAGYFGVPVLSRLPWVETHLAAPVAMLQEAYRVEGKLMALLLGGAIAFAVGLLDDVLGQPLQGGLQARGPGPRRGRPRGGRDPHRLPRTTTPSTSPSPSSGWWASRTPSTCSTTWTGSRAGVAFVASLVLLVNAWLLGEFFISLVLVAFMGSLLGFLVYNWHPASIFLGDCGSLFIGFTLASLTLLQRYVSHASAHLLPGADAGAGPGPAPSSTPPPSSFIRLREGRPIYVGDSRHLSHRLVSLGMRPPLAVFTIYLIALGIGLGAVGLAHADLVHALLILVQALAVVAVVLILLFYERRTQPRREDA